MGLLRKERLVRAMGGQGYDRPPVICPGGMMSAATLDVLARGPADFHIDALAMAQVARAIQQYTGFENLGVPFCMTVEAESWGAGVDLGTPEVEPRITRYSFAKLGEAVEWEVDPVARSPRGRVVLEAIGLLKRDAGDLPVVANLTGPVSLATSLMEPMDFFRLLRRDPVGVKAWLDRLTHCLVEFGQAQVTAGADVVTIADPTATGEILGKKNFDTFAAPYLARLVRSLQEAGAPVVLHICGNATQLVESLRDIPGATLSFDAMVDMGLAQRLLPGRVLMGNVSTILLHQGEPEKITLTARRLVERGVAVISPACGISLATPRANLRALTRAVQEG